MSGRQKVCHDVKFLSWRQKVRHDVKNTSRRQKLCYGVIGVKSSSWCQKCVMASKCSSRICHDMKKFGWRSKNLSWDRTAKMFLMMSSIMMSKVTKISEPKIKFRRTCIQRQRDWFITLAGLRILATPHSDQLRPTPRLHEVCNRGVGRNWWLCYPPPPLSCPWPGRDWCQWWNQLAPSHM